MEEEKKPKYKELIFERKMILHKFIEFYYYIEFSENFEEAIEMFKKLKK